MLIRLDYYLLHDGLNINMKYEAMRVEGDFDKWMEANMKNYDLNNYDNPANAARDQIYHDVSLKIITFHVIQPIFLFIFA